VKRHIDSHRQNPLLTSAVLGYVTWAEEMKASPFMRWYGEHMLFGFNGLRGLSEASFRQFYTCNVSLKTEFLRTNGQFDEDFKTAAYEDAELGFRLDKKGMRLLYNPAAIAYHYQHFSFQEACQKRLKNAAAAHTFSLKEAGLQLAQEEQQRRSKVAHALVERLAPWIAKILYPLRWFLDSAIALPGIVYHLFFWLDTRPADRAK
jgi:GT2 family glycosyltransferase